MYKEDLKKMMSKALAGISEEDVAKIEAHLFRIYFCYRPQSLRIALFLCKIYNIILVKGVTRYRLES
jgi:hypothetical protein